MLEERIQRLAAEIQWRILSVAQLRSDMLKMEEAGVPVPEEKYLTYQTELKGLRAAKSKLREIL